MSEREPEQLDLEQDLAEELEGWDVWQAAGADGESSGGESEGE